MHIAGQLKICKYEKAYDQCNSIKNGRGSDARRKGKPLQHKYYLIYGRIDMNGSFK
jgi:hypothetical protein